MDVETLQSRFLFLFHYQRMCLRVSILAHSRHLPGNFDIGCAGANGELVILDLLTDDRLRELSDPLTDSGSRY